MANRIVRIYSTPESDKDIIGFSASAGIMDPEHQALFHAFMDERGYQYRRAEKPPLISVSWNHIEVEPPMSEEHIQELSRLCIGGYLGGEYQAGIISAGNGYVVVHDNRNHIPSGPYDPAGMIACS